MIGRWLDRRRQAKAARLLETAVPTLRALGAGGTKYYGRSVDRLFLDGGSRLGFSVCCILGWAEWCGETVDRESLGRLTDVGRDQLSKTAQVQP